MVLFCVAAHSGPLDEDGREKCRGCVWTEMCDLLGVSDSLFSMPNGSLFGYHSLVVSGWKRMDCKSDWIMDIPCAQREIVRSGDAQCGICFLGGGRVHWTVVLHSCVVV